MAVAWDSTAGHSGSGVATTGSISIASITLTAGQYVVVVIAMNNSASASVGSVTDTAGNKYYQKAKGLPTENVRAQLEIWVCEKALTMSAGTVTIAFSVAPGHSAAVIGQYSGVLDTGAVDVNVNSTSTDPAEAVNSQGANSWMICGYSCQGTGTVSANAAANLRVSVVSAGTTTTAVTAILTDQTAAGVNASINNAAHLSTTEISQTGVVELMPAFTLHPQPVGSRLGDLPRGRYEKDEVVSY